MLKLLKSNKMNYLMCILLIIFMMFLTSCVQKINDDIKVESFSTEKEYYDYKEVLTFSIRFDNKKNYVINAVEINKKSYPVICSDQDYSLVYVTDESLIFTIGNENYTLSSFTYTKTENKNDSLVTEKCSYRHYVVHSLVITNDIKLKEYTMKSSSEDGKYYINEKISVVMTLENENAYEISKVDIEFVSSSNKEISQTIVLFAKNAENAFTRYKFDIDLPEISDLYSFSIKQVYYTKNSRLTVCEFNDVEKVSIDILKREVEVMSLEIDKLNSNDIFIDVNGETYTDEKNTINLKISLRNPSAVKINSLIINGQEYIVRDTMISTNTISKISTIKLGIKMSASTTSGKLSAYQVELQAVRFYDKTSNQLTMPVKNNLKLYIYDKIITKATDLSFMKYDETTKTITGNYILNNDIVISNADKGKFFEGYVFSGLIEGNGHSISFSSDVGRIETPLFEKIDDSGIIKNLNIKQGVFYNSNVFANHNFGTLKNIESSISILHNPLVTQVQNIRGGLVGTNDGNILDILLKGNIEIAGSNINNNTYGFSLISDTNNGNINRVVNNIYGIKAGSAIGNCLLFLTSRVNNGTINAIVYTFQNVDIDKIQPIMLVTDSLEIGEKAVFSDVFLNSSFVEKVGLKNDIDLDTSSHNWWQQITKFEKDLADTVKSWFIGTTDTIEYTYWVTFNQDKCEVEIATPTELGYTTTKEHAIAFYSSLLFASGGYDNFWQYNIGQINFNYLLNK